MSVRSLGFILLLVAIGGGVWKCGFSNKIGTQWAIPTDEMDAYGFATVPLPDGMSSRGIVIFTPANCPSDAAQRAESLARYLSSKGIAYAKSTSAEYNNLSSREEVDRVLAIMNGPIPVVYVNGKAKANPTPEEVEGEYWHSKRS